MRKGTTKAQKQEGDRLLGYFDFRHLPPYLQDVSKPFHDLAHSICTMLHSSPERTVALRKLLEAKDCAVRARLDDLQSAALQPKDG